MLILHLLISVFTLTYNNSEKPAGIQIGTWRGVLTTNGGELPFTFETKMQDGNVYLEIINGEERIKVDEISMMDDSVFIHMPVFDSEFRLKYGPQLLTGLYINHSRKSNNIFPFRAAFGKTYRFTEEHIVPVTDISGRWEVDFSKGTADSTKAVGIFSQKGNYLTGTFLTTSGDYRYLEGTIQSNHVFLSCFDGSHAFLFKADIEPNGSMKGMYYSGNHWQEPWLAKRNSRFELPDPYSLTFLKAGYNRLDFSFPDLNGNTVSLSDDRFKNKVVIVQIMGSWCPNCMDETAVYAPMYDKYQTQGLEIIALAYEKTDDFQKAKQNLERWKSRFNIHYTMLVAGQPGAEAAKTLPMLNGINSYPTSIFIDRNGKLRKIYTGINGPATGSDYEKWKDDTMALVEKLLAE